MRKGVRPESAHPYEVPRRRRGKTPRTGDKKKISPAGRLSCYPRQPICSLTCVKLAQFPEKFMHRRREFFRLIEHDLVRARPDAVNEEAGHAGISRPVSPQLRPVRLCLAGQCGHDGERAGYPAQCGREVRLRQFRQCLRDYPRIAVPPRRSFSRTISVNICRPALVPVR